MCELDKIWNLEVIIEAPVTINSSLILLSATTISHVSIRRSMRRGNILPPSRRGEAAAAYTDSKFQRRDGCNNPKPLWWSIQSQVSVVDQDTRWTPPSLKLMMNRRRKKAITLGLRWEGSRHQEDKTTKRLSRSTSQRRRTPAPEIKMLCSVSSTLWCYTWNVFCILYLHSLSADICICVPCSSKSNPVTLFQMPATLTNWEFDFDQGGKKLKLFN